MKIESKQDLIDWMVENCEVWPNCGQRLYHDNGIVIERYNRDTVIAYRDDMTECYYCTKNEWQTAKAAKDNTELTSVLQEWQQLLPQDHELIIRAEGLRLLTDDCKEYFFQEERELIEALELIKKLKQWEVV